MNKGLMYTALQPQTRICNTFSKIWHPDMQLDCGKQREQLELF